MASSTRRQPEIHRPTYRQLLVKLRRARETAGLTQPEVADLLGRSRSHISKCETGERRLGFIDVVEFAALYDKPLTYFAPSLADLLGETPGLRLELRQRERASKFNKGR
jgi:transcriptional regulator with XRE-family HTH domain